MGTKALLTVEQFAKMKTEDTEDYELVDGELIPLSSGTYRHNKIRDLIGHLLWVYFRGHAIGEAVGENDCVVAAGTIRRPDVSVFLGDRLRQIDLDKVPSPIAPDIAMEVLSPSEPSIEVRRKVREYLRAGSQEVWLMDPANVVIEIHASGAIRVLEGSDSLESPLLPGFSIRVSDLLGEPGK